MVSGRPITTDAACSGIVAALTASSGDRVTNRWNTEHLAAANNSATVYLTARPGWIIEGRS